CQCEITTLDISKEKLELVKENSNRLRLNCLNFINLDVKEYSDDSKFDRILLDAPCTSIATGNKNPEVLLRLRRDDFERMSRIQRDLLKKAVELLRDGGKILYSVCTVSKCETTEVIRDAVKDEGLESMDLSKVLNGFGVKNRWDGYGSLILPEDGYSPMYYAVLVKGQ
ncbi:MAG: 16S rRNA (cytosine(967)-C(5))-methyltransferase, partial [Thermotogae bacterium]|nr:16S rRNA (cytosine(967)-C(5))-methyltransferase [Thermotogota bacterium]